MQITTKTKPIGNQKYRITRKYQNKSKRRAGKTEIHFSYLSKICKLQIIIALIHVHVTNSIIKGMNGFSALMDELKSQSKSPSQENYLVLVTV